MKGGIKRGKSKLASNNFPMCSPQSGPLRDVHRVTQRREEGVRRQRWQEGIKGEIKRRETDPASNQFLKCWVEKRKGREETEATWWRKRRVQRRRECSKSHSQVKLGSEVWVFKCTKLTTKTKKQRLKI